ncbi:MAG: hypothetical protein KAX10_02885 [Candidatus Lokiarchaeota archaeon]|nr:hypothetical protein [Candidatus Lokiarchaeota archaeon]
MKKKSINLILILNFLLILAMFISVNIVVATNTPNPSTSDNIDDPANDVITYNNQTSTCESTSLHPILDIDSMVRSGQEFTVTLYELFPQSGSYQFTLILKDGTDIYYIIYVLGGVTYDLHLMSSEGFWNGSEFTLYMFSMPVSVGSVSGKIFSATIPTAALLITSSIEWTFMASYYDSATPDILILDVCPDSYIFQMCPDGDGDGNGDGDGDGNGDGFTIPAYEIPILLGITTIFTMGLIYIQKKRI